ncbi:extracellular solute-binding protein [Actibacterium pelagium]|uniref:ABC transporter substrate-binding protein n=1 Tax=Actibacterium pelagium TaxID=2029103 RepID=A0A917AFY6_9RHOB|nr:extracellular solute-binding protein [Actibacterium pelagium]GGE50284.1 ABC transporter substrate-binding protein [Actibacterium pelagium]
MPKTVTAIAATRTVSATDLVLRWLVAPLVALLLLVPAIRAETITAHGISTFGQLKYPADYPHLDYVNPDAPKGGEISVWAFGSFDSMNPYSIKGRSGGLASVFFESLLSDTSDEIGSSYGLLAESLEYPEDRSWVIFNIRPEAKFSDGSPVTAEDVRFSYETFLTKGLNSFRAQLSKKVKAAEVLGPNQIKFTFNEGIPTRDLPQDVGGLPVFSKAHYIENGLDLEESSLTPMLGSGPYVLDRMEIGETLVYRRNPDYWGVNVPLMVGRNNFDRIRIEYYADYNAAFEGFKGGSYTFRNEASSKIWATSYDFPSVQNGTVVKAEIPHGSKATGQAFIFNLRREKFQDPRVREAIGLMFNFEWSNETLFYGLYDRVNSFWDNSTLAATGTPSAAELALLEPLKDMLPEGVLTDEPVSQHVSSSSRQLDRKALRTASALLDEAGWIVGDDGMRRNAKGELLEVSFLNDSQTFNRLINPLVENLKRLGVAAEHEFIDNAQMTNRERPPAYDFDIVTGFMSTSYIPGTELRQYYGSETADSSTFNKAGLADPAVDALIEEIINATTQEEMNTAISALDRVLRAMRPWIPQWNKNAHTVAYYDMYEYPDPLPPFALGNLDFWWYNAEKAEKLKASGALK